MTMLLVSLFFFLLPAERALVLGQAQSLECKNLPKMGPVTENSGLGADDWFGPMKAGRSQITTASGVTTFNCGTMEDYQGQKVVAVSPSTVGYTVAEYDTFDYPPWCNKKIRIRAMQYDEGGASSYSAWEEFVVADTCLGGQCNESPVIVIHDNAQVMFAGSFFQGEFEYAIEECAASEDDWGACDDIIWAEDLDGNPNPYTCEDHKGWNHCDEPWMDGYCRKTCGKCSESEQEEQEDEEDDEIMEPPMEDDNNWGACDDIIWAEDLDGNPNPYTCEDHKGWNHCDEPWMDGYCRKTCGKCSESEQEEEEDDGTMEPPMEEDNNWGACDDIIWAEDLDGNPNPYTCEDHKGWNHCDEPWMDGYCRKTCGKCSESEQEEEEEEEDDEIMEPPMEDDNNWGACDDIIWAEDLDGNPNPYTCEDHKGWNHCDEPWMDGYCRKTCGKCSESEQEEEEEEEDDGTMEPPMEDDNNWGACDDIIWAEDLDGNPNPYTCEDHKGWNHCDEPWMDGYCRKTCGKCSESEQEEEEEEEDDGTMEPPMEDDNNWGACDDIIWAEDLDGNPNPYTCEDHKGWNHCDEPWMDGYCRKTCGKCSESEEEEQEEEEDDAANDSDSSDPDAMEPPIGNEPLLYMSEEERNIDLTTRYFDGCKPACGWSGNVWKDMRKGPMFGCGIMIPNQPQSKAVSVNAYSACSDGGTSYACLDTSAFTENGQRYGFVALPLDIAGGPYSCCECYEAVFLEGPMEGETIQVQAINSGEFGTTRLMDIHVVGAGHGDNNVVAINNQDLVPFGGGKGKTGADSTPLFAEEYWGPQHGLWGERFSYYNNDYDYSYAGGVSSSDACELLPSPAIDKCKWEFSEDGFRGASIPRARLRRIKCPSALHSRSGCLLEEDALFST